jgi:hypothetical protein
LVIGFWGNAVRTSFASFIMLMTLTVAATSPSCTSRVSTPAKACGLSIESPHVSRGQARQGEVVIVAKIRVECDQAPITHTIVAGLAIRDGDNWVAQGVAEEPDHRIPQPGKTETYYVTHSACVPGSWLASVTATGSMQGRSFEYAESRVGTISQASCSR